MKRRGFFKALAGVGAAPAAAAVAAGAKALEAPDELEVLKAWIEQAFACEQGLLGAWADERGTMKYVTLACAARVSDWPDERAAKAALVAHERERVPGHSRRCAQSAERDAHAADLAHAAPVQRLHRLRCEVRRGSSRPLRRSRTVP
jgi:hypothetical protein